VNLTCGDDVTLPLFFNLSSPEYRSIVGDNFVIDGRSQEVAVFRFDVSVEAGTTTTVNVDTCGANTNFGTSIALFEECPDPWAALTQSDYIANHALSSNDDDSSCSSGAMTSAGISRASKVSADVDETVKELYVLVSVRDHVV
jgi:hypothetical protein